MSTTRRILVGLVATAWLLVAPELALAQESFLPQPLDEIETIIELLDAVDAAELAILAGDELSERELEHLTQLGEIGDTLGAADLAARARSLLVLARPRREAAVLQPELDRPLAPSTSRALIRGSDDFQSLVYIFAATGATALVLSGGFYALAEREYQLWRTAEDPDAADERFQAWRGYDLLSLGLGATALASGGIAIPSLYGLASTPASLALPIAGGTFTATEQAERLLALYAERADLVSRLNALDGVASIATATGVAVGLAGAVTSVTMFYLAGELYDEYLAAPFSADALELGNQVRLFDLLAIISGSVSAAGFSTAIGVEFLTDDRARLETAIRRVNRDIVRLRTESVADLPRDATE